MSNNNQRQEPNIIITDATTTPGHELKQGQHVKCANNGSRVYIVTDRREMIGIHSGETYSIKSGSRYIVLIPGDFTYSER